MGKKHTLASILNRRAVGPAGELKSEIKEHYHRWMAGKETLRAYPYIKKLIKLSRISSLRPTIRQYLSLIESGARVGKREAGELWGMCWRDFSAMSRLVDLGLDVNARDMTGSAALKHAAQYGPAGLCAKLLAAGAQVNARTWSGSALDVAARWGNTPFARKLLAAGAWGRAWTPLKKAAMLGRAAECRRLLRVGVSPNATGASDELNLSPLFLAATHGHVEVVRLLLEAGAHPNEGDGLSPLQGAAERGHVGAVEALLAGGASPGASRRGSYPLLIAAKGAMINAFRRRKKKFAAYREVSALLLRAGADVNTRDIIGMTPLHYAVMSQYFPLCDLLVQAGADINAQDDAGFTPLHVAAFHLEDAEYAYLVYHGGDESICNNKGFTPAAYRANDQGKPAFSLAEALQRELILQPEAEQPQLRALSCDFVRHFQQAEQGEEDMRAFPYIAALMRCAHLAKKYLPLAYIKTLLRLGADASQALSADGNTPLHEEGLTPELCNVLLAAGADLTARNAAGLTPAECHSQCLMPTYRKEFSELLKTP